MPLVLNMFLNIFMCNDFFEKDHFGSKCIGFMWTPNCNINITKMLIILKSEKDLQGGQ